MFMSLPDDSEIQCITCIKLRETWWKEKRVLKSNLVVQTVWVYWLSASSEGDKEETHPCLSL